MRDSIIKFCSNGMLVAFAALVFLSPGPSEDSKPPKDITFVSYSDPVPADTSKVWVSRIDPEKVRGKSVWIVSWSDGAVKVLTPCVYEDGKRCYWEADSRGNHIGQSFVVARGKIWYIGEYAN